MTAPVLSGGCQCGAIRYKISAPLGRGCYCHCRMCQKAFGSPGAALVLVRKDALTFTRGKPSEFRSSSIVSRGFCSGCGTPLYMLEDGSEHCDLAIGSLDNPADVAVTQQAGMESKLPWFDAIHEQPAIRTDEERTAADLVRLKTFQHPDHD